MIKMVVWLQKLRFFSWWDWCLRKCFLINLMTVQFLSSNHHQLQIEAASNWVVSIICVLFLLCARLKTTPDQLSLCKHERKSALVPFDFHSVLKTACARKRKYYYATLELKRTRAIGALTDVVKNHSDPSFSWGWATYL